jgi:hypothetical protein
MGAKMCCCGKLVLAVLLVLAGRARADAHRCCQRRRKPGDIGARAALVLLASGAAWMQHVPGMLASALAKILEVGEDAWRQAETRAGMLWTRRWGVRGDAHLSSDALGG